MKLFNAINSYQPFLSKFNKFIVCLVIILTSCISIKADNIVVAYLTSNSTEIPTSDYVTHVNYAFGYVNDTFNGICINNPENLKRLTYNKGEIKILLSIGGWTSGNFSEMAASTELRLSFANDCKRVIDEFNLDGIDIDWEYPTSSAAGISSSPNDTDNYTLLMSDIRNAIGNDKLLTLASIASAKFIDFKAIEPIIDFVNIMVYDIARPPYHHAALFPSPMTKGVTCDDAVRLHIDAGLPVEKLVLGIPFYGHGVGNIPDFIDYKDIIKLTGYNMMRDNVAKVPYLTDTKGNLVCTYDDDESISEKCQYAINRGLKGIMYWNYCTDDSNFTLRKTVANELLNKK